MKKRIIKNLLRQVRQLEDDRSQLLLELEALSRAVSKRAGVAAFSGSPPVRPETTYDSEPYFTPGYSETELLVRKELFANDGESTVAAAARATHGRDEWHNEVAKALGLTANSSSDSAVNIIGAIKNDLSINTEWRSAVASALGLGNCYSAVAAVSRIGSQQNRRDNLARDLDMQKALVADIREAGGIGEDESILDAVRGYADRINEVKAHNRSLTAGLIELELWKRNSCQVLGLDTDCPWSDMAEKLKSMLRIVAEHGTAV